MTPQPTQNRTKAIKYSKNWNHKLNCKYHTTIRLFDNFAIGEAVHIELKGKFIFRGRIASKKNCTLATLPEMTAALDTGLSLEHSKLMIQTMYKNYQFNWETQPLYILLIENIEWMEVK